MSDPRSVLERESRRFIQADGAFERLLRRRDRKRRNERIRAGVLGLAIAIAAGWGGIEAIRSMPPVTADPSEDLGIFEPVAGRIVYYTDSSLWGFDPNAPSLDSTLVRIDLGGTADAHLFPLGWSSDGTELLFMREDPTDQTFPYARHLYILHADGSETQVTPEPVESGAAISPDGSRVVFAPDGEGLYIVDAEGGQPVRIAHEGASPTFSPDGTQIAYLSLPRSGGMVQKGREHVWVANADGTDAHEILADEPALAKGLFDLTWSPSGDRIAMANSLGGHVAIYTFAPDGSDFTEVITGGFNPYWSPDGSQIAYGVPGRDGVSLADADGSNVRAFGFAASGPWHPGAADEPTPSPAPSDSVLRRAGEVLLFTGTAQVDLDHNAAPGDLVAVTLGTGEQRVLAEDLDDVSYARWSADGQWVAFEMAGSLWVIDQALVPRQVFGAPQLWTWSSTGARLAVIRGSTLSVVDPSTGRTTELASTVGDVTSAPAWSPDGRRIVFGARGGSISSVDVRTGEHSRLVQLPGENLDEVDGMAFSPDGSRLVILYDFEPAGDRRLVVMNADGSDIAVLAEGEVGGFDWSPDGSLIAFPEVLRVFVAPADGSTRSLVASLPNDARTIPAWSPDGSQIALGAGIAFLTEDAPNLVIDADGSGDAVPLADLTYESWRGGSYDCDCDLFG